MIYAMIINFGPLSIFFCGGGGEEEKRAMLLTSQIQNKSHIKNKKDTLSFESHIENKKDTPSYEENISIFVNFIVLTSTKIYYSIDLW